MEDRWAHRAGSGGRLTLGRPRVKSPRRTSIKTSCHGAIDLRRSSDAHADDGPRRHGLPCLTASELSNGAGIRGIPEIREPGTKGRGDADSGVWPGMRANTSKTLDTFSDFLPSESIPMFPRFEDLRDYLRSYANAFDLNRSIRLKT